uniref:Aminopeptidase n=1 Tax=Psilocybe cubensis TaxID=181762 RepID=A0A8H7XRZ2_PSICU
MKPILTSNIFDNRYRLPTKVKPYHYDLIVKTDLEQLKFEGFVKISLDVKDDTSELVLHVKDLELRKAWVSSDCWTSEKDVDISSIDDTLERVTYRMPEALTTGSKAALNIRFSGSLTGNMMGYYRSRWETQGKTQYYSLTQFEATAARRAFPCWDEPLLKATFSVIMISRMGTVNLSNMSVVSERLLEELDSSIISTDRNNLFYPFSKGEWKVTKFDVSPPMSSYVVAFANGPFAFIERSIKMPLSGRTIPLRIYSTPDLIGQAQFALDVKAAALPLYEKMFGVEYPLPKLDTLVASDFDPAAMENWGLITGRLSSLLIDPDRPDTRAMKEVASIQSHEVAHMWFGNITTLKWWTYVYLNEEFRLGIEFINKHLVRALKQDAKLSSHPVQVDSPDASDINQIFDNLSYSKGASVLLMLSSFVGEESFLKGVSIYLKKNLFGNSVTRDLWDGISAATGLDIGELMNSWITATGYPVISVTENANGIIVRQDRFLEAGHASPENNQTLWTVPLAILMIENGRSVIDRSVLLKERENFIALDTNKPYKLNAGTQGVYLVLYTPERLSLLAAEAKKENSLLDVKDRLGLIHDTIALALAGYSKLSVALTFVSQFNFEEDYMVWQAISDNLADIQDIWWEFLAITNKFQEFRRSLYSPLVSKLGYNYPAGEPLNAKILRTLAISQACDAGDECVVSELKRRFDAYIETGDDSQIPVDLQNTVYTTATRYGGMKEYRIMRNIYDNPKSPTQQNSAIFAMANTQDTDLLEETLIFVLNNARDQDILIFVVALAKNYKARRMLTTFIKENYDQLVDRFKGTMSFSYLISRAFQFYSSKQDYQDIVDFFKDKDTSDYNKSLAQGLESIHTRANCIERNTRDLKQWLSKFLN